MNNLFNVALLQLTACKDDQQANLKKDELYCRQAKSLGADIAVFPEMWNVGYAPFEVGEQEGVFIATFNIDELRDYR